MIWNEHSKLKGAHAILGASRYHWIRYDEQRLESYYRSLQAVRRGDELHDLAQKLIKAGVKLPKNNKTLNAYVNDAIGFRMRPEQILFYSYNCFGTADAVSFRKNMLRIHDLKTGAVPAKMDQLHVYAAFFCLEYGIEPADIGIELRIYQNDQVLFDEPPPEMIRDIMDKTIIFDKRITDIKLKEEG